VPLSFAPATADQVATGRTAERDMVLFDFPSGLWGFFSGEGTLDFEGVTYIGAGRFDLADIRQSMELAALKVSVTLFSRPGTPLTPDVLATIEQEQYHQRPVRMSTAFFNPDTGALLSVEVWLRGYVDRIVHTDGDDGAGLEVQIETRTRDITKSGYRVRSDADQRLIDPTDDGLRHVATVHTETVYFGRVDGTTQWWRDQQAAANAKKKSKLFGIF